MIASESLPDRQAARNISGRAAITYSAAGLPSGCAINSTTGVISGAPQEGSETTVPIPITLQATDGTDTAQLVLGLTIADGIPAFKVNASDQPAYPNPSGTPPTNLADTTLSFTSSQPGALAGRVLRVQASTNPTDPSSWNPLANGTEGFMIYDSISRKYLLGTSEYPHATAVYFRTQTRAPGKPDAYSNVVGPLDLSSTAARLGTTKLYISRNGPVSNIRFGVTAERAPAGLSVKMQTTKTPAMDGSWTDVANGTLAQDGAQPNELYLGFDDYPAGDGNYFRAVAAAPGFVTSVSGPQDPFTFIFDPAPRSGLGASISWHSAKSLTLPRSSRPAIFSPSSSLSSKTSRSPSSRRARLQRSSLKRPRTLPPGPKNRTRPKSAKSRVAGYGHREAERQRPELAHRRRRF